MNGLALCAGIGGLELGIASVVPSYRTVCYVEGEAYAAAVLAARMAQGRLHQAPIWDDIRTFRAAAWRGIVDIVTAGYPCQPFSLAGRRAGEDDPRHLWPSVKRIVKTIKPPIVFLENVPGHITMGLETVGADLRRLGYCVQAGVFSAEQVGAPHVRKRLFILAADTERIELWQQPRRGSRQDGQGAAQSRFDGETRHVADATDARCAEGLRRARGEVRYDSRRPQSERLGADVADADGQRQLQQSRPLSEVGRWPRDSRSQVADANGERCSEGRTGAILQCRRIGFDGSRERQISDTDSARLEERQGIRRHARAQRTASIRNHRWAVEPNVGRVADGIPARVDRLRALGNAVVPQTAALAFSTLMGELRR